MEGRTPILLNDEFKNIVDQLERSNQNFFITGRAGTGKSTLLQLFRNTTRKKVAVLAPTGIAALNVKGQTLHSFFGLPPKMVTPKELGKRKNAYIYKRLDAIIIDEISMVRADMIDNINILLQNNRGNRKPFGGVQVIFFGDLFQLPPVVASAFEREYFKTTYESPYFFSSHIIQSSEFEYAMVELYKVYRQGDRRFINLLDNIRLKHFDRDDLMEVNSRFVPEPEEKEYYITLTSRNNIADQINQREINKIDEPYYNFQASIFGQFNPSTYPTESILSLKKGAQVMFVKNDPMKRFVNGTIGIIEDINNDSISVKFEDITTGKEEAIEIEKLEWEILKYKSDNKTGGFTTEVVGTFKQFPIKLAWAITIHKSQGKTFDKVIIDMGRGAFEYGQTYVALSRCRTLEGIILKRPLSPRDIIVDDRIVDYYEHLRYYS